MTTEPDNPDPLAFSKGFINGLIGSAVIVIVILVFVWVCAGGMR